MPQHRHDVLVDPRLPDDAFRRDMLDRPEQQRAELEGIDAQIEQASAAEVQAEEAVLGIDRPAEPEVGLHEQRLADPTGPDHLDQ